MLVFCYSLQLNVRYCNAAEFSWSRRDMGKGEGVRSFDLFYCLILSALFPLYGSVLPLSYSTVYYSDSTVSEDAGIEPRTVATFSLTARRSNRTARSHQSTYSNWKKQYFQSSLYIPCMQLSICILIQSHLLLIRIHAAGGNVATEPTVFKRKTPFPLIVRGYLDDISCFGSTQFLSILLSL
jgi:hypothetical protein